MVDIVPALLEEMQESFKQKMTAKGIIAGQSLSFEDSRQFNQHLIELLQEVFTEFFTEDTLPDGRLYFNIAKRIVLPMIKDTHGMVIDEASVVQKLLDTKDGFHLNPVRPDFDTSRVEGIVDNICQEEIELNKAVARLNTHTDNIVQSYFDDFVKVNSDFHYKAGIGNQIIRSGGSKCCEFCKNLNGVYDYEDAPDDIYRRHENCSCSVIFKNNSKRYLQGVHSKQIYRGNVNKLTEDDIKSLDRRKKLSLAEIRARDRARYHAKKRGVTVS